MCRIAGLYVLLVVRVVFAECPVSAAVIMVGHVRFHALFDEISMGAGVETVLFG